jgi:hypothetical protein
MLILPARIPFPVLSLTFAQCMPVLGGDAKMRLRSRAKGIEIYRTPVRLDPLITGRNDAGEEIPIDTLGKWLFGVPGYRGHINVLPSPTSIEVRLYSDLPAVRALVQQAAEKLGLALLWVSSPSERKIIELGGYIMASLQHLWSMIVNLCQDATDIGPFPAKQIEIGEGSYAHCAGDPVRLWTHDVQSALSAWSVYEQKGRPEELHDHGLARILEDLGMLAGQRLGLDYAPSVHFGDWLAQAVTGWFGGHGNDEEVGRLESVASAAVFGHAQRSKLISRAYLDPEFFTLYRPAIPAIVATLKRTE